MARNRDAGRQVTLTVPAGRPQPEPTGIPTVDSLNADVASNHVDTAQPQEDVDPRDEAAPTTDQTLPGDDPGSPKVDAPRAQAEAAAATAAADEAPKVYTLADKLLELEESGELEEMAARDGAEWERPPTPVLVAVGDDPVPPTHPTIKIGDMVLYHGKKPFPPAHARGDHPALVTAVQPPAEKGGRPVLWLAVFLPNRMESVGAVSAGDGPGQWAYITYPTLPF